MFSSIFVTESPFRKLFGGLKQYSRGQVHEESAEVLCLAGLKGLVHRVGCFERLTSIVRVDGL